MMLNTIKKLLIALFIIGGTASAFAAASTPAVEVSRERNDSLTHAYSVILASYLLADLPVDSIGRQDFISGFADALMPHKSRNYYYGLLNGIAARDKLMSMDKLGLSLNDTVVVREVASSLSAGKAGDMTLEQANGVINAYLASMMEADTVSVESQKAFITQVVKTHKVTEVLPTGVVIIALNETNGRQCVDGNTIMMSYKGSLSDGTVFDETSEPIEVKIGNLVPGFNQGLMHMTEGSTYRLVIPAAEAYGKKGISGVIPGNAALDFVVTINKIL